jgi:hypothetical protein
MTPLIRLKLTLVALFTCGLVAVDFGGVGQRATAQKAPSASKSSPALKPAQPARKAPAVAKKPKPPVAANPAAPESTTSTDLDAFFASRRLHEKLGKPVTLEKGIDPNTPLRDALEFLSDRYQLSIIVDASAFKASGLDDVESAPIKLQRMTNVRLDTILQLVAAQVGGSFLITADGIKVTTPQRTRPEDWIADRTLPPLVTVRFASRSLRHALEKLSDVTGITIALDPRETTDMRVTETLNNVPVDTAVRLLADMCDLEAVALDSVLYVTSKSNAEMLQEQQEIRRKRIHEKEKIFAAKPKSETASK